ncbi:MAG: GNAT family N-acetyltransferase [Armatimonadetes bacterium]|nr:GNAT family N-acetyltransferase [Armatimonadota bacterium]
MSKVTFFTERTETPPAQTYPPGTIVIRAGGRAVDIQKSLQVREAVFVGEQNVPLELERDEYDADALHILAIDTDTNEPVGTARIVDKGNGVAKIGRVAVLSAFRGMGVGDALMNAVIETARTLKFAAMVLDAQLPVIAFYERFGFVAEGEIFLDAGIEHRRMTRPVR